MNQFISQIALVVDDYDEAISFYTNKLKFRLIEDTILTPGKRWVIISPEGSGSCRLLLAKASNEEQKSRIGNQAGGRVFLFLFTDNIERDHQNLIEQQIKIIRPLISEPHGKVLVFEDLYGNLWDLIEPS